ncbi:MAG: nucleotidyltransferase domain-containing protein [Actinomycetota bacterium]
MKGSQRVPRGDRRQAEAIARLVQAVKESPHLGAAVITGSFARGRVDPLSDIDLLLIANEGDFERAWKDRRKLHVTGCLLAWDNRSEDRPVGAHKWITPDLVLVECLISAPSGGARLAEPFEMLTGDRPLVERFPRRPPIDRSEMTPEGLHPVELAYDRLKEELRRHLGGHAR